MSANRRQVQLKLVPLATSRWEAMLADMDLFLSLCVAWLIVKRTLRRQSAERATLAAHPAGVRERMPYNA